jgi:NAD(P)-dependent dehydrogenase (short-subunit alcohol dehydrogenase family)
MAREVVIVTGGSRGIGAAICKAAAAAGYGVCLSYVENATAAEAVCAAIAAAGGEAVAVRGDVADPAFAGRLFDAAAERLGPATALVNNAGVTGRLAPFREAALETMRRVLDVNLLGTMVCAQEAVRRWAETGTAGRIVNLSSIAATLGAPNEYVVYAATKAGVETFTLGLAKEVAALGIRVNAVAPGTIYTDIHATAGEPGRPARVVSRVPMGRIGEPEEIAEAVVWLLGDKASYVTGTVLRVSGGV